MNLIESQVAGIGTDEVLVGMPSGGTLAVPASPDGIRPGDDLTLGVRPDHVRIGAQGPLTGRVELVEELARTTCSMWMSAVAAA